MKKLFLIALIASASIAKPSIELLWEGTYTCIDPCKKTVSFIHSLDMTIFADSSESTYIVASNQLNLQEAPNGCKYDLMLKHAVSRAEFENTLINAGFNIVSSY